MARQHGIADNVLIQDEIGDDALRRELEKAHVALMPSHSEAFGLSIAEAQAAGLPLIGYEVGSVPEVVEKGRTAWLAPFREMDALAGLIREAMADPEQTYRMGMAGRERIAANFTWDRTARAILDGANDIHIPD